jgi:hypothetical protein
MNLPIAVAKDMALVEGDGILGLLERTNQVILLPNTLAGTKPTRLNTITRREM